MQDETIITDTQTKLSANLNAQPELFNDVMLDLHVEIGRAKIKISHLLNMTQGEVIQLEQSSSDPLIIYANNKAIAKGQIVSSNGKYNIRIL